MSKDISKCFEIIVFGEETEEVYVSFHFSEYFGEFTEFVEKTIKELIMSTLNWHYGNDNKIYLSNPAIDTVGCELCKSHVSSILAILLNEMILKKGKASAQDSKDRFLVNIQKRWYIFC